MIYNVWLPLNNNNKIDEFKEVEGTEEEDVFKSPPFPLPSLPSLDYQQELEIHTEGLQFTFSDEEPHNVSELRFSFLFFLF